jgi:internalin A
MNDQFIWENILRKILDDPANKDIKSVNLKVDAEKSEYWQVSKWGDGKIHRIDFFNITLDPKHIELFVDLHQLQTLCFSNNKLSEFPENLAVLKHLNHLEVINNKLRTFSTITNSLHKLQWLKLDNNSIQHIKASFSKLSELRHLSLSDNGLSNYYIEDIPFDKLQKLEHLSLDNNELTELPGSIGSSPVLNKLSVGNNKLTYVPASITQLSALVNLNLQENKLTALPDDLAGLSNLSTLRINNNEFEDFPNSVFELSGLSRLYLHYNKIGNFPSQVKRNESLGYLNLSHNHLENIPSSIFQLVKLRTLNLSCNQIKQVNLVFPSQAHSIESRLTHLDLSHNGLQSIPQNLSAFTHLKVLNLSNNYLENSINDSAKETSTDFSLFQHLEELNLSHNTQLSEIPEEFLNCPNLTILRLEGCGFIDIPDEVLYSRDAKYIINYLNRIEDEGSKPINEGKIIILGHEKEGKTSLILSMLKKKSILDPPPETESIDITPSALHIENLDVRMNIWDFGGQEIMHAMHEFFMTPRTIYILACSVDHSSEEIDNSLIYWLELIGTFGGKSPVIVALTKDDDANSDYNSTQIKTQYPQIYKVISTSSKKYQGVKDLLDIITDIISSNILLPAFHKQMPVKYFAIKEEINQLLDSSPYLDYNNYIDTCKKFDVDDNHEQESLLISMHYIGIVFYRKHLDITPSILKPQWVIKGVYSIVNNWRIAKNQGEFYYLELKSMLANQKDYDYTAKEDFILKILENHNLCVYFDEKNNDKRYLISSAIGSNPPSLFNKINQQPLKTVRYYKYPNLIPRSWIPQIIVLAQREKLLSAYWKNGVILKYPNTNHELIAYLIEEPHAKSLYVVVIGESNRYHTFWDFDKNYMHALNSELLEKYSLFAPHLNQSDQRFIEINYIDSYKNNEKILLKRLYKDEDVLISADPEFPRFEEEKEEESLNDEFKKIEKILTYLEKEQQNLRKAFDEKNNQIAKYIQAGLVGLLVVCIIIIVINKFYNLINDSLSLAFELTTAGIATICSILGFNRDWARTQILIKLGKKREKYYEKDKKVTEINEDIKKCKECLENSDGKYITIVDLFDKYKFIPDENSIENQSP